MATNIKLKSSSVSGKTPTLSDLSLRELAVNTADGKLFLRKGDGSESDKIIDVTASIQATSEPMGHEDKSQSVISFNTVNRRFTIQPVSTSFNVWCKGIKYNFTTAQTVDLPNTTGIYYIYFDGDGALQYRVSYFDWENDAPTAYVYWNATTGTAPFVADERHGIVLDWQTHEYLHRTRGAVIANGFSISNYTTTGTGANNSDAQFDLGGGTFFDEDLEVQITHSNTPTADTWEQDLAGPSQIPVFYQSGNGWVRDTPTDYALKQGTARIKYNLFSGGSWTTPDVPTNTHYTTSWIIATNNINYPVISIMGQSEHNKISDEESLTFGDLILDGFPVVEFRPLYKIIWQTDSGYANTPKAVIAGVYDIRQLTSGGGISGTTPVSDHGLLTGLGDDDHLQYLHVSENRTGVTANINTSGTLTTTNSGNALFVTAGKAGIGTVQPLATYDGYDSWFSILTPTGNDSALVFRGNNGSTTNGSAQTLRLLVGSAGTPGSGTILAHDSNDATGTQVRRNSIRFYDTGIAFEQSGNTDVLTIDTTNSRVGVGITNPSGKFVVDGGEVNYTPTSTGTGLFEVKGGGTSQYTMYFGMDTQGAYIGHTGSSRKLFFDVNETTRMTINASGNVGIGITNPATKLEVNGSGRFTGNVIVDSFVIDSVIAEEIWSNGDNNLTGDLGTWTLSGGTLIAEGSEYYVVDDANLPSGLNHITWVGNSVENILTSPTIDLSDYVFSTYQQGIESTNNNSLATSKIFLTVWAASQSLDSTSEYLAVDLSLNNGTNWSNHAAILHQDADDVQVANDTIWRKIVIDITDYCTSQFKIRFRNTGTGSGDSVGVSNLYIHQAPVPTEISFNNINGTNSIKFRNTENSGVYYKDVEGVLAYDANFYNESDYGTGAYDPQTIFTTDGGGLILKDEEGWAAIFSSQNSRFAQAYWDKLFIGTTDATEGFSTSPTLCVGGSTANADNFIKIGKRLATSETNLPFITHGSLHDNGNDLILGAHSSDGCVRIFTGSSSSATPFTGGNDERMTIRETGNVGIGTTNPTTKLHLYHEGLTGTDVSSVLFEGTVTDINADYAFTQKILTTLSGTDATTADREQGGLYVRVNSTSTGGDISNEHRAYGILTILDVTGDSDIAYGNQTTTQLSHTDGTISNATGNYGMVTHSSSGPVTYMMGGYSISQATQSCTAPITYLVGQRGRTNCSGTTSAPTVTNIFGVWGNIDNDSGTSITHTGLAACFYGSYDSTTGLNNTYGVYINANVKNYFEGTVGIGTDNPLQTLHVTGTGTITGNVGIGTTNPGKRLHVYSDDPEVVIVERQTNNNAAILYKNSEGEMYAGLASNAAGWAIDSDNNIGANPHLLVTKDTGNVGIGTSNPSGGHVHIHANQSSSLYSYRATGENSIFCVSGDSSVASFRVQNSEIHYRFGIQYTDNFILRDVTNTADRVTVTSTGNVGIGITTPSYKLQVNGSFAATTKSFVIPHPTKEGMTLRYGSLEGPENGVYVRGRITGSNTIELPDYWTGLVDEDTITVNLTPIGRNGGIHSVIDIVDNTVVIESSNDNIDCFYMILGERKDVAKLEVEF